MKYRTERDHWTPSLIIQGRNLGASVEYERRSILPSPKAKEFENIHNLIIFIAILNIVLTNTCIFKM